MSTQRARYYPDPPAPDYTPDEPPPDYAPEYSTPVNDAWMERNLPQRMPSMSSVRNVTPPPFVPVFVARALPAPSVPDPARNPFLGACAALHLGAALHNIPMLCAAAGDASDEEILRLAPRAAESERALRELRLKADKLQNKPPSMPFGRR